MAEKGGLTYRDAGVDIDAQDALVERIKPLAQKTLRKEVLGGIGGFSGLFQVPAGFREPILVSGTDGVGTKLTVANAVGNHDTIGIDLVAMCVNDILVTGAEPLFFLDYFATGKLDTDQATAVIKGIADGCVQSGCTLLGGETAEMPGLYAAGDYDLAGFAVGVVERSELRDGRRMVAGDRVIGIASSGVHSNGFSLARRAIETLGLSYADRPDVLGKKTLGQALLEPTRIYAKALLGLRTKNVDFKCAAHITGGGLIDNPPRMLPKDSTLALRLRRRGWPVPAIFQLIQSAGIDDHEMLRTFNMGVGMIIVVDDSDAQKAVVALQDLGEKAFLVGDVITRSADSIEFVG